MEETGQVAGIVPFTGVMNSLLKGTVSRAFPAVGEDPFAAPEDLVSRPMARASQERLYVATARGGGRRPRALARTAQARRSASRIRR